MGCMIVFVILLVIGIGILCFLTGDMTAFIALAATLVIGLGLAGILYHIYKSKQRRMEKYNPLSPTLRWMNAAGSILIAASQHTNFHLLAGWRYNNEFDRESIKTMLWGSIALIGPTRMPFQKLMPLLHYFADQLGEGMSGKRKDTPQAAVPRRTVIYKEDLE